MNPLGLNSLLADSCEQNLNPVSRNVPKTIFPGANGKPKRGALMLHAEMLDVLMDKMDSASSSKDVWEILYNYVQIFNIDALTYYHKPPAGSLDYKDDYFIAHGFNEQNVTQYKRRTARLENHLTHRSMLISKPTYWDELLTMKIAQNPEEGEIIKRFYDTDNANGIALPTYGPNGRNGCIVLRFADKSLSLSRKNIRAVQWAAQTAHMTFCNLRAKSQSPSVTLTSREREVLTWVARGKSNSVIADIVGISQHTVTGYLRRIYLKTGTSDRTTATILALGESLIDL